MLTKTILIGKTGHKFVKTEFREILRCNGCCWLWKNPKNAIRVSCPKCGKTKDARDRRNYYRPKYDPKKVRQSMRDWRDKNFEKSKLSSKSHKRRLRKAAMMRISNGNIRCINCGCDRMELLEINHKNGGGTKEIKKGAAKFIANINNFSRSVDDLELTCKVCNSLHYLESRYGKLPFKIVWTVKPYNRNYATASLASYGKAS